MTQARLYGASGRTRAGVEDVVTTGGSVREVIELVVAG